MRHQRKMWVMGWLIPGVFALGGCFEAEPDSGLQGPSSSNLLVRLVASRAEVRVGEVASIGVILTRADGSRLDTTSVTLLLTSSEEGEVTPASLTFPSDFQVTSDSLQATATATFTGRARGEATVRAFLENLVVAIKIVVNP